MPSLDRLDDDESFEAFKQGVDSILDAIDDPEHVRELVQEGEYESAQEHIYMAGDDMEIRLQILHGLANKIVDADPELKRDLRDELPEDRSPSRE